MFPLRPTQFHSCRRSGLLRKALCTLYRLSMSARSMDFPGSPASLCGCQTIRLCEETSLLSFGSRAVELTPRPFRSEVHDGGNIQMLRLGCSLVKTATRF